MAPLILPSNSGHGLAAGCVLPRDSRNFTNCTLPQWLRQGAIPNVQWTVGPDRVYFLSGSVPDMHCAPRRQKSCTLTVAIANQLRPGVLISQRGKAGWERNSAFH